MIVSRLAPNSVDHGVAAGFQISGTVELSAVSKPTGRPSKGSRKPKLVRLPDELAKIAEDYAAQQGMTFNDLAGELLAQHLRDQGFKVRYSAQEALRLSA
jgi:predicted HicB family RNase H-like nuclease